MKFNKVNSNTFLRIILMLNIILVISIYFLYRPYSWPIGSESFGCLLSLILIAITVLLLWLLKDKITDDLQKRNVSLGLIFGLLWTIEIGINNLIRPGLPLRDNIDDIFLAIIALLILITAIMDAYRTNKFLCGVKSGFWTGLGSGAIACFTALILIVFGMKYLLLDPVNIKEWTDIKATENSPGIDVYFAYQTFTGAVLHLYLLGAILGLVLGSVGGLFGKALLILKK
jgi:hypothetical protein